MKTKKNKYLHAIHIILNIGSYNILMHAQQAYYNILKLIYLQSDHNIEIFL